MKIYDPLQQAIKSFLGRLSDYLKRENRWRVLIELLIITGWVLWLCRGYFTNFDKLTWPIGREFGIQVYSHHFWMDLMRCGSCALWNGSINGGAPALADPFGSAFHPVVMVTTLLFGVVNGVKVATVIALWVAGFAQWWIAKILETGWFARIWSAMLVVVGGHLLGRLELGAFGLALSMASISLVLASAFWLAKSGGRRPAVILAFAAALALVAGHGYLQLGLISLAPAFLFLLIDKNWKFRPVWRDFLLAGGLSILLAGFFLIPVLHFAPNIEKFTDPSFESAQPLEYIPLNLVIRDWNFYNNDTLGKYPFPYLYNLFIGWWPVLLAILSLYYLRQEKRPILFAFLTGILMIFFVASGIPFRWLVKIFPILAGVRHVPLIAGLLVPLLLGLAAASFDEILRITWPDLILVLRKNSPGITLSLRWLLLIPAIWSISLAYNFNKAFLDTTSVEDVYDQVWTVQSEGLHWIEVPFGEHWWVEPALDSGLKLTNVVMPWWWKGRQNPQPYLMARPPEEQTGEMLDQTLGDKNIFLDSSQHYAFIESGEQISPCQASGWGGQINVVCSVSEAGDLIVRENMWSGWKAWMDGERIQLIGKNWLRVKAPAGEHTFQFRYQPRDVSFGIFLSLIGLLLSIYFWRTTPKNESPADDNSPSLSDP